MMRQQNLIIAFVAAVAIHAVAAVITDAVLRSRGSRMVPDFRKGESALNLTLIPVRATRLKDSRDALKRAEMRTDGEMVQERQASVLSENDADELKKGVEEGLSTSTEIRPRYPFSSRLKGEMGVVTVRAVIDSSGSVSSAKIEKSSGYTALDNEAVKSVKRARFKPEQVGGRFVEDVRLINVDFRLVDGE